MAARGNAHSPRSNAGATLHWERGAAPDTIVLRSSREACPSDSWPTKRTTNEESVVEHTPASQLSKSTLSFSSTPSFHWVGANSHAPKQGEESPGNAMSPAFLVRSSK